MSFCKLGVYQIEMNKDCLHFNRPNRMRFGTLYLAFILALDASGNTLCKYESPLIFEQLGGFLSMEANIDTSRQLTAACRELGIVESYKTLPKNQVIEKKEFGAFRFLLDSQKADVKESYLKQLYHIAKLTDRNQRIREAYKLAAESFNRFEFTSLQQLSKRAGLLDRSAQRSALLAMTLLNARSIPSEYDVMLILSQVSDPLNRRSWVRLNLSNVRGKPARFDFDASSTGVEPQPLVLLHEELIEKDRVNLQRQCQKARLCLMTSNNLNKSGEK